MAERRLRKGENKLFFFSDVFFLVCRGKFFQCSLTVEKRRLNVQHCKARARLARKALPLHPYSMYPQIQEVQKWVTEKNSDTCFRFRAI